MDMAKAKSKFLFTSRQIPISHLWFHSEAVDGEDIEDAPPMRDFFSREEWESCLKHMRSICQESMRSSSDTVAFRFSERVFCVNKIRELEYPTKFARSLADG